MQKILSVLLLFFVLIKSSHAEWENWKEQDRYLFVASEVAMMADWATTRYGVRHFKDTHYNYYETNFMLGKYPSMKTVDIYMTTMLVSNYYIADWIPDKDNYRSFYLGFRTLDHGLAARHNLQFGWHLRF